MNKDPEEVFKYIFNTYGTYQSLQKDVAIVKYFQDKSHEKIRQKEIIEYFKGKMTPKTVREHLYRLVKKEILKEDLSFKGTYTFYPYGFRDMAVDMDGLVKAIVGEDIYNTATSIWKEKYRLRRKYEESRYESEYPA